MEKGEPFDLVLTDGHMPEMDGFGLAERLKQVPQVADTPVILLTSGDRLGDARRCRISESLPILRSPFGETNCGKRSFRRWFLPFFDPRLPPL